jgi:hypothetical protein
MHIAQRGRHLGISLELPESMRFERSCSACEIRRSRWQSGTLARLPTKKQSRSLLPHPLSVHAPNKKGEHAPTNGQKHHGYSGGYALQHNELPTIGMHPTGTNALVFPCFAQLASMVDVHRGVHIGYPFVLPTMATLSTTSPYRSLHQRPLHAAIEEMARLANSRSGMCLSPNYLGSRTKLLCRCGDKHRWYAVPGNVKRGNSCPVCAGNRRLQLKDYRALAAERGGKCLSRT